MLAAGNIIDPLKKKVLVGLGWTDEQPYKLLKDCQIFPLMKNDIGKRSFELQLERKYLRLCEYLVPTYKIGLFDSIHYYITDNLYKNNYR